MSDLFIESDFINIVEFNVKEGTATFTKPTSCCEARQE